MNLDIKRVVGYRQFCNKIWNAFRFASTYLTEFIPLFGMDRQIQHSIHYAVRDQFILSRLYHTIQECDQALANYQFGALTSALHSFFLYDFCDVYLELIKPVFADQSHPQYNEKKRVAQATLYTVLENYLRLLHPVMPFITEELWQRLPNRDQLTTEPTIMLAQYPRAIEDWKNVQAEKNMEMIKELIHGARSLRSDYKVANHIKADFYFRTTSESLQEVVLAQTQDFCTLAKGNSLKYLPNEADESTPKGLCIKVINDQLSILVDLTGLIDVDTELKRLNKDIER